MSTDMHTNDTFLLSTENFEKVSYTNLCGAGSPSSVEMVKSLK